MIWTIVRICIYILVVAGTWLGTQFYIANDLWLTLQTSPTNAIYVDQNVTNSAYYTDVQNTFFTKTQKIFLQKLSYMPHTSTGTSIFPFATISDALTAKQEKNISTIIVASGTYNETLILPENTILFGNDTVTITAKRIGNHDIITPKNNTALINLTLSGGDNCISIPEKTNVRIFNVTVENAKDFGIEMDMDDEKRDEWDNLVATYNILYKSPEEIDQIPLVRISNSKITKNGLQGLYLADGRVEIENTIVSENGEEGIDLHPHLHTTIKNVISQNNGEGGLESEIYDNIATITDSTFDSNVSSGLAFITHIGTGKIILKNNTITNNQKYGIRCTLHKKRPTKPKPFFQTTIERTDNFFEGNILSDISYRECFTF